MPCSPTVAGKQWPHRALAEDVTPSRCRLHIPASSKLTGDLRPSLCSARSNLEHGRHRLRCRQNPCPFLYLCINLLYDLSISMPMPCLRAGLFMYLSLSCAMEMCYSVLSLRRLCCQSLCFGSLCVVSCVVWLVGCGLSRRAG